VGGLGLGGLPALLPHRVYLKRQRVPPASTCVSSFSSLFVNTAPPPQPPRVV
jgi:hypothetical protein